MSGLFKRINFFKGLFMKTKDWQREQEYHMEKQRFHNKYLHTPGVVFSCLDALRVSVSDKENSLAVSPGYAIDGEGRDLYVPETKEVLIPDLQSFNPPATIYIALSYSEKMEDKRDNTTNPMYSGNACVTEDTVIEITTEKPDNYNSIELARVKLSEDPGRIRNPGIPPDTGKAVVPAVSKGRSRSGRSVVPAGAKPGIQYAGASGLPTEEPLDLTPLDELILAHVPEAGTMSRTRGNALSISDLGEKLLDTRVVVIAGNRKQEDTNILIEQYPKQLLPPMYLVFVQSLEGARIRWSVVCTENDEGSLDYTLHLRNETTSTITVMCRVYRVRI
ncbi:MAG: hypothetical protein GY950_28690 [bacterium]|nr:hypothetical protein [bacterium]